MTRLIRFARLFFHRFFYAMTNAVGRWQMLLNGVELGRNVRFFGLAHVEKSRAGKVKIGENSVFRSSSTSNLIGINRPCIISSHGEGHLTIGKNCGFSGTVIGCFRRIVIEDNVRCGANSLITDSDWHLDDPRSSEPKPVYIERNVWLGVNVMVLKGVRIGENSVIGAGSVVTADIPANVVAAGNPCKVIRPLTPLQIASLHRE